VKLTVGDIKKKYQEKEKISMVAAYSYNVARTIDGFCDVILVGDSVGMVLYGMESTLEVGLDLMINHGRAVVKGVKKSLVVVDMPYGTYEKDKVVALKNAKTILIETGADAVKLEGGEDVAEVIKYLSENDVAVMAHVGLQPQSVNLYGGFKIQGRGQGSQQKLWGDVKAVNESGAFAVVIEGVVECVAEEMVKGFSIPAIGIGASKNCAGQVLVLDDLLGVNVKTPKFVKKYANFSKDIQDCVAQFDADVKNGSFPDKENLYEN
jgi:3-methyl-2-oxobutanoate hydroxymethyltransferase